MKKAEIRPVTEPENNGRREKKTPYVEKHKELIVLHQIMLSDSNGQDYVGVILEEFLLHSHK